MHGSLGPAAAVALLEDGDSEMRMAALKALAGLGRFVPEALEAHADAIRETLPFNKILVEPLREDWPETREIAERRIREFVGSANTASRNVLVIPFRVHGFGPYADVLEGLDYIADGQGLVPHPGVTEWIERQIELLSEGPFLQP